MCRAERCSVLIFARDEEQAQALRDWAEARIPHLDGGRIPPAVFGGVVRGDKLAAVVAFYDFIPNPAGPIMRVSVAAENVRWARPHVIAAIYHYAFAQAGAYTLEAGTPLANEATCKLLARIGFKRWGIRPHAYGRKKHQALYFLTADMWRQSPYHCEV